MNEELGSVHRYTMEKGETTEIEWTGRIYRFVRLVRKDTQPVEENLRDLAEKRKETTVHIDKGKKIGRGNTLSLNLYEIPYNALRTYKRTHEICPRKELLGLLRKWYPKIQDKTLDQYLGEYLTLLEESTNEKTEETPSSQDFSISEKHQCSVTDQDKDKVIRGLTTMWRKKIDTTTENIRKNVLLSNVQLGATIDALEKERKIKKSFKKGKKCYNVVFGTT